MGIKYPLDEAIIVLFLRSIPISKTIKAIIEPINRMIPRSPALRNMLTSIKRPKIVEIVERFLIRKVSSTPSLTVCIIQ